MSGTAARSLGKPGGINNTAYLFFVLALAFLFYITARGDLGKWLGLLGLSQSNTVPGTGSSATATGTPSVGGGLPGLPSIGPMLQTGASQSVGTLPSTSDPFGSVSSDASNIATYGSGDLAPGNIGGSQIIDVFGPQEP